MDLSREFKGVSLDERVEDERLYEGKIDRAFGTAEEDEHLICRGRGGTAEENAFDEVVGALENIIMEPGFAEMQTRFCQDHCELFDPDEEENKLEYTTLFHEYTDLIEGYLESRLQRRMPGFRLDKFAIACEKRKDEVCGDVFDILLSLGDFDEFKDLMVSHRPSSHHAAFADVASNPDILCAMPMMR
ncbi:ADP-ribosylation factor-like protein 2-binding protein [Hondaea fermentalgiana]|uniref:ADP-ribosylation factor-like protein 2-binding protein n=1 Tax=Hondaea fermentalgiana TaxID=2315210 RepID=A0A2R5GY96_9STRA|nr:ADP-ribosylation factor-like protein 2-binding protein [Hondaea fermentalgiana]|eukprot:GBG34778.1 ADP-ribosylation factor-like protein 2-binding protein [Hondaea fermentalgiana]